MKNNFDKPILKVGQLWRNGVGEEVKIVGQNSDLVFPFLSDDKLTYAPNGSWRITPRSKFDLVEMIENEHGNPVTRTTDTSASAIPTPENYKRIDHEDGRIEFIPIEEKKEEYFDFGEAFNLNEISYPIFIGKGVSTKGFKHKELLVYGEYKVEVVEQGGYTRLRFKGKV